MRFSPSPRDFVTLRLAAAILAVVSGGTAWAVDCGDKVDGERIACSCGDNVVSDTTLMPGDPVVPVPCSGDGLIMFPPGDSPGITLNLGGLVIRGNDSGSGIKVVRGGQLGSAIVGGGEATGSRAAIVGFGKGISAAGSKVLTEIRDLDVHDNKYDGLRIRTSGVRIENVDSHSNGRDGVVVSGHGNEVEGVVSSRNHRDGVQVRGSGTKVDAQSVGNNRNGTVVGGRGHEIVDVESKGNGGAGLHATGGDHRLGNLDSSENSVGDVTGRQGALK
jgi:hypothetical protein